jgi:serine/threonine protein kinase
MDDYKRLGKIGEGGFGAVFKVMHKNTQEMFVMKEVDLTKAGKYVCV